jgi:hypothetical protein
MTPAQRDRLTGFNASLKQRGVSVTLRTNIIYEASGSWTSDSVVVAADDDGFLQVSCFALIEPLTAKLRQQLDIADEQITHFVHVLRTNLVDGDGNTFDRKTVTEIDRADSEHTYRVQNFTDDAQRPAILFHSILA